MERFSPGEAFAGVGGELLGGSTGSVALLWGRLGLCSSAGSLTGSPIRVSTGMLQGEVEDTLNDAGSGVTVDWTPVVWLPGLSTGMRARA